MENDLVLDFLEEIWSREVCLILTATWSPSKYQDWSLRKKGILFFVPRTEEDKSVV